MTAKVKLGLHLLAQILAQGAVVGLVHSVSGKEYLAAVVAVVGVTVAFFDSVS